MEGQFKDGEPNGWIREIYQSVDSPAFRVYWCENDIPHGYFYQQDYHGSIESNFYQHSELVSMNDLKSKYQEEFNQQ